MQIALLQFMCNLLNMKVSTTGYRFQKKGSRSVLPDGGFTRRDGGFTRRDGGF